MALVVGLIISLCQSRRHNCLCSTYGTASQVDHGLENLTALNSKQLSTERFQVRSRISVAALAG